MVHFATHYYELWYLKHLFLKTINCIEVQKYVRRTLKFSDSFKPCKIVTNFKQFSFRLNSFFNILNDNWLLLSYYSNCFFTFLDGQLTSDFFLLDPDSGNF